MKSITVLLFLSFSLHSSLISQEYEISNKNIFEGTRLYAITFLDSNIGIADSYYGEVLVTTNGGSNWKVKTGSEIEKLKAAATTKSNFYWSVNIYCDVRQSTDGGETWSSYPQNQEEHFCTVYFRDKNTGWKVAEEFLQNVVLTIQSKLSSNNWDKEIGLFQKCREYYTDIKTGWWVGWCFKNLVINEDLSDNQ